MAFRKWFGIGLIGLSGIWFAGILMTPFLALSLEIKAIVGLVFAALMEVSFWLGSLIVGKQIISRYWLSLKRHLGLGSKIVANDPSQNTMDNVPKASSLENVPNHAFGHQGRGFVFLVENLPYAIMIVIGVVIFLLGFGFSLAGSPRHCMWLMGSSGSYGSSSSFAHIAPILAAAVSVGTVRYP